MKLKFTHVVPTNAAIPWPTRLAGTGVMTLLRMRRATLDLGGEPGGLGAWVFWNGTWLRRPRFGAAWLIDRDKSLWRVYGIMMDSGAGLKERNRRGTGND